MTTELARIDPDTILTREQMQVRYEALLEMTKLIFKPDLDYGIIPGSAKPSLLKPGAEKICSRFRLEPRFEFIERVEDWTGVDHGGEPFFYYLIRCTLYRIGTGISIASADASCNSFEGKYRWRWVSERDIPEHLDKAKLVTRGGTISEFGFAIDKAETSGPYGKPAEYWQMFQNAIANGTARQVKRKTKNGERDAWEIDSTAYRVPNENICDQVNTILKIGEKRSLVATTLIATGASEFFTQDLEDLTSVIEATYTIVDAPAQPAAAPPNVDPNSGEIYDTPQGAPDGERNALLNQLDEALADENTALKRMPKGEAKTKRLKLYNDAVAVSNSNTASLSNIAAMLEAVRNRLEADKQQAAEMDAELEKIA